MTENAAIRGLLDGEGPVDEEFLEAFAALVCASLPDVRVAVRAALRVHGLAPPGFEIRTGAWRLDLDKAIIKAVSCGAFTTLALQALGEHSIPAAVVAVIAPFVVEVERVEVSAGDYWVYARLLDAANGQQLSAGELYERLPDDIKAEVPAREYLDILERLQAARLLRVGGQGVQLGDGRARRTRLMLS